MISRLSLSMPFDVRSRLIVQKWQSGELANNGMMLKLSADDLETFSDLKYALDQEKVLLRVFYSYEYK